jgi:hypothetical protein
MSSWRGSRALHADAVRHCDTFISPGSSARAQCTWHVPKSRGQIVLLGDSNAGQFTEPVVLSGNRAGFDVTVLTFSSCPYVGIPTQPSCERFTHQAVSRLVHLRPNLVILASRTDVYLGNATEAAALRWQQRLTRILGRLNRVDVPVVIVHPVPRLPISPDRCAVVSILTSSCGSSRRRVDVERELGRADAVEQAAAASAPLTATVDLNDDLCSRSNCTTMRNGALLYRDDEHLSVQGALTLTGRFTRIVAANARAPRDAPD